MPGGLTLGELAAAVADGAIDTVLVAQVDMQGRLMGKRFQAEFFLESAHVETHGCNYLLATDFEMETVPGYKATSWAAGYGDYVMKPDLATLRRVPWLEGTALVLCDVLDHHGHGEVPHSPRAILKRQIARLRELGLQAMVASELEFFLFSNSYAELHARGYRGLTPVSPYNEDYHIFQTTKEEDVMRAIRTGLNAAGIPVEMLQGRGERRAGGDQRPLRRGADRGGRACRSSRTGSRRSPGRRARRSPSWRSTTPRAAGSSSHLHLSLRTLDGKPAFFDPGEPYGMSKLMRS